MDSEVVTIILKENSYIVDATFDFFNTGEIPHTDSVGFPKRGYGSLGSFSGTSDFIHFETWVNGAKVDFIEVPDRSSIEGPVFLPSLVESIKKGAGYFNAVDYRWLIKEVIFPPKAKTTTRVRYEAPYDEHAFSGVVYIYGTGSYWKDPIGKATFIVDRSGLDKSLRPETSFPKGTRFTVKRVDANIVHYVLTGIEPGPDDTVYVGLLPSEVK